MLIHNYLIIAETAKIIVYLLDTFPRSDIMADSLSPEMTEKDGC